MLAQLCKLACSDLRLPKLSERSELCFGLVEGLIFFCCALIGCDTFECAPAPVPWRETFGRHWVSV